MATAPTQYFAFPHTSKTLFPDFIWKLPRWEEDNRWLRLQKRLESWNLSGTDNPQKPSLGKQRLFYALSLTTPVLAVVAAFKRSKGFTALAVLTSLYPIAAIICRLAINEFLPDWSAAAERERPHYGPYINLVISITDYQRDRDNQYEKAFRAMQELYREAQFGAGIGIAEDWPECVDRFHKARATDDVAGIKRALNEMFGWYQGKAGFYSTAIRRDKWDERVAAIRELGSSQEARELETRCKDYLALHPIQRA